ncbi:uncharacterized protein KD926_003717 [Aspergillus affinis]|uniref:uncharacterized protein n=1 Tax=Aspergillus affinis TaxID=1070780 RepID=UPI0022FE4851|nr:uncharacterized protein KD926_003717 [Aspergillus affinis]KAI9035356.1 hypothetical protein KD926_003717 [Aspergillus affinis]
MNVWSLLPFLGLLLGVQSRECTPPFDRSYFNVTDQHYIDALSSSCTVMLGSLLIATNFTGQFLLPNITNITGSIMLDWWDWKPTPNVTSIDLPDLQYLESSIEVAALSDTLERISIPKLEYLRSMILEQYIDNAEVDFRGLQTADVLYVRGNYSKVSFDSLQNVTDFLSICNQGVCSYMFSAETGPAPRRAMEVSLPNLEVAHKLTIAGDLSELIAPKLSNANLIIQSANTSVEFDFPHLTYSHDWLDLEGHITRLSIPRLDDVAGVLKIQSSYPLNVTLPLTKGDSIIFHGQIEDVSFPNLKTFDSVHIETDLPLDCDSVVYRINETSREPHSDYSLGCKSPYEKPSGGLSTKAKIAIGVVVGVVGLGIIVGGILFWKKKRVTKKKTGSEVELTTFGTGPRREEPGQGPAEAEVVHDPPPPYTRDKTQAMDEKDLKACYRPPLPPRPSSRTPSTQSQHHPTDEKHLYDYTAHAPVPGPTHTTQDGFAGFTYAHSPFDPPPLPAYSERPEPPTLIRNQIEDGPREGKLPCVIPQTSHTLHGTIYRPFARAYPPALATTTATYNDLPTSKTYQGPATVYQNGTITQTDFLAFIDGLNAVWLAHPYLQAASATTSIFGFVPLLEIQLAALGVQVATELGSVKLSQMRTQAYLRLANEELFVPRGLRVQVLKTRKMMEVVGVPEGVFEVGGGKEGGRDGEGEEVFEDHSHDDDDVQGGEGKGKGKGKRKEDGYPPPPQSPSSPLPPYHPSSSSSTNGDSHNKQQQQPPSPTQFTNNNETEANDPQLRRMSALHGYVQPLNFTADLPLSENWLKRASEKQSRVFASRQNAIFSGKRDKATRLATEAEEASRELDAKLAEVETAQGEIRARARDRLEGPLGESMQGRLIVQEDMEKEMRKWEKKREKIDKEREKRVTRKLAQSQRGLERVEKREMKVAQRVMWVVVTEDDGRGWENHLWEDSD